MSQAEQVKPVQVISSRRKQLNVKNGANKRLQTNTAGQIMGF